MSNLLKLVASDFPQLKARVAKEHDLGLGLLLTTLGHHWCHQICKGQCEVVEGFSMLEYGPWTVFVNNGRKWVTFENWTCLHRENKLESGILLK